MNSKKVDQLLVSVGVLLIIISSYQLFLWRTSFQSEGLSLGVLDQTISVVKIKNTSALDWKDGNSGDLLGDKQLIYTDDKSSAAIKLINGHEVKVSENSLIRISALINRSTLNIEKGYIRARINSKTPLFINANGSELKLTGENADVQVSVHGDTIDLGVISGEVAVEKDSHIETINSSRSLKFEAGNVKVQENTITILKPLPGQTLYSLEDTMKIDFEWNPSDPHSEVLVADNPMMKKAIVFRGNGTATGHLEPGNYYWRVEDDQSSSMLGSFRIIAEKRPEVIRPLSGETFTIPLEGKLGPQIFLQWVGKPEQNYLVEWSDGETHQKRSKGSGILLPLKKSGPFSWRVKIDSVERTGAQWSEMQNIDVTLIPFPSVPENLLPNQVELQSYTKEESTLDLNWKATTFVDLEIITPSKESVIKHVEIPPFKYSFSMPGQYKWRARGKDQFSRVSAWSDWKSFTLEDLVEEASEEGYQKIVLKRPDQSVTFSWDAEESESSTFELSSSATFSEVIIQKKVSGKEVNVVIPHIGNYYWRSRRKSKNGLIKYSAPKKVLIEAAPAPAKPMKLPDLEVPLNWEETHYKQNPSWWNLFISTAYADDFKSVAKITLPLNEDAKKYVVKIFKDAEGTELILEKILDSNTFTWTGATPGLYYWQYALVDHWARQSPFSDLSAITVTGVKPIKPIKPKLQYPTEGAVLEKELKFSWSPSRMNKSYRLEVAADKNFSKQVMSKYTRKNSLNLQAFALPPGDYYWRVVAIGSAKSEAPSPPMKFTISSPKVEPPPIEKITIIDMPAPLEKKYLPRISFAWAPSGDDFTFKENGQEGRINGTTLNSFEARGIYFTENFIFSSSLLRQSGAVFDTEKYSFGRLALDGTWKFKIGDHLWGPGLSAGYVSGHSYEINNSIVSDTSASGLLYGAHLEGFYTLNPLWEFQSKFTYFMGSIPHFEIVFEANRKITQYYLILGAGHSQRSYSTAEGSLRSLRLSLGFGKEF